MRKILAAAALTIAALTLTACGSDPATKPDKAACARDAWTTWHRDGEVFITRDGYNRPKSCIGLDKATLAGVADNLALKLIAAG